MVCNKCRPGACTCGCSSSGVGAPYYSKTPMCVEDHIQEVIEPRFAFALCPTTGWNVPLCGGTSVLNVPGVEAVSVGSYIYNSDYGYFEISGVDYAAETITVTNNCTAGNASPGTQIPQCTCFVVTVPPAVDPNQTGQVCLEVDFTAPIEGVPLDITLTSTSGISPSDTVEIGSGFYFVQEVKPDNIITIVNVGQGIIPGTPVIAKDLSGNYQYCLSIIGSNPCALEPVSQGTLIVCGEDGVQATLGSPCEYGYIPVAMNDCQVEMLPAVIPPVCQRLTQAVDIVSATTVYTVFVADRTGFPIGSIVQLSGLPGQRPVVTGLPGSFGIQLTFNPAPGVNVTLPAGDTLLCQISCCESLGYAVETLACYGDFTARYTVPVTQFLSNVYNFSNSQHLSQVSNFLGGNFAIPIDPQCPGATYTAVAICDIGVVPGHTSSLGGNIGQMYHETELVFNPVPSNANRVGGKSVWMTTCAIPPDPSGFVGTPPVIPAINGSFLVGQLGSPIVDANLAPLFYHSEVTTAVRTGLAGGTNATLSLFYKAVIGTDPPDTMTVFNVQAYGNVFIFKSPS